VKGLILLLALFFLPASALARSVVTVPHTRLLNASCLADAAKEFDLPLAALAGLLAVEGGKEGEALRNANGTWDLGPFQINTCNLNELAAQGFSPDAILADGCVNARAAAWILRREYARTGDLWKAIGAYHSRTPHLRDAYIARVQRQLARLGQSKLWPHGVLP
jgi:hypothetical protein